MDIYILRDGKELGPFDEDTIQQMLKQGTVLITDLGWSPGMPQWIPLHGVLYPAPAAPTPPPSPANTPALTPPPQPPTAKQKAFLAYFGLTAPADLTKEQAALLVNDTMESPTNAARIARWNEERMKLHPDLFAEELQAKKEARAQHYFEVCQTTGAEMLEGVTKAHCQVLVGYLDVKFPNWDANEAEAARTYFFPAVAEKFPQLVKKGCKEKLAYPQGPKVAPELKRGTPAVSSPQRKSPSAVASLAKGLFLGLLIVGLTGGGLYLYKNPAVAQTLADRAKAQLADMQKPSAPAKPVERPAEPTPSKPASETPSLFAGTTSSEPQTAPAASAPNAPAPAPELPAASSSPMAATGTMAAAPDATPAAPATGGSLFDVPSSSNTAAANAPAVPGLPGPKTSVILTQPAELQLTYGKIKIPAGTQLPLVEQDGVNLKVRFQNQTVSIPANVTDLGGDAAPQ